MILVKHPLTIRGAEPPDAEQLCIWWNDGAVMAHAGFPNGLGETVENVRARIMRYHDEVARIHIIELDGVPIGEMHYRNVGNGAAEIGIKICDFNQQGKGYGLILLDMFIGALFTYYGYEKITLDTNIKNERAQHIYEHKLGFRRVGIRENCWRDQLGVLQSAADYELTKEEWRAQVRTQVDIIRIRLERPADYRAVEELTREAFWNRADGRVVDEHLLAHRLREIPGFVPELDYVAEIDGKLAGNVMYSKAKKIAREDGTETEVLTFGPLSVLPEFQRQGVGSALMAFTIAEARRLGFRAILFFSHPDYYPRFGFRRAAEFGITTENQLT